MTVDPVKVVVTVILEKDGVYKNLHWGNENHEPKIVDACERNGATEAASGHVGDHDQEGHQTPVKECL